ncbi:MAG: hypothetical protein KIS95_02150 [Anaerolineae bacterium]|uniref:hypothetical protein n=1 Tax=Promineifilum sp. TaxID=2664178 RepID=UPI001D61172F|nr:hypothetical protein [Anaerolineales bacterium]MCO5180806.1 hypothetical protein [Promineifilum sp.]MCW5846005.1 hypothetical protein [Anaerolineae bacterium]
MKRSKMLVVVVVLLLTAMVPLLASAGSLEQTGRIVLRGRGEYKNPLATAGIAKSTEQLETAKTVPGGDGQILPQNESEKLGLAPISPNGTLLKFKETFEGVFPSGWWIVDDLNGGTGGYVCWDDDDYKPKKGQWSAWAANGCADGLDPQYYYYRNDMASWTDYLFSTAGAKTGTVKFNYWNNSEYGYDYFYWCASVDYANWYCSYHTGSTNGKWKTGKINLKKVPGFGSMLGYSNVYVGFGFSSDGSIVSDGAFIDDVAFTVKK